LHQFIRLIEAWFVRRITWFPIREIGHTLPVIWGTILELEGYKIFFRVW